ncbi:MAG TPA: HAMP domain-containing sensor histidine kinase [Polyangia bacterium]|nr:HAMP domain-containing sensor histidine kinase [Polyangia bacterium]
MLRVTRSSIGSTNGSREEGAGTSAEALERLDRLASASVLAAGLAHEIASPLGALLGALDSIERRVRELRRRDGAAARDVDELAEELEIATESTSAITDLVHDFQSFLRAGPEADPGVADVQKAVERALRLARARLRAVAHVEVELRAAPLVHARASRIVQVVLNLVLNALEALASRERSQNRLTVRVDVAAGRALIEVSDNGPGLPRESVERLFEVGVARRVGRASSGLGLPISRELVRKMGGEITVSSLPGAGTTFLVSLPPAA